MRPTLSPQQLVTLTILLIVLQLSNASLSIERIIRRQSGEGEQESTTAKTPDAQAPPNGQQSPRLYPDLPRQPNFLPPFNGPAGSGFQPAAPFAPFGMQMPPPGRLNIDQQPAPFGRMPAQPRPMTAAERLQSQSFANGLGRRLLTLAGVDLENKANAQASSATADQVTAGQMDEASRALQNASVLERLNQGVHSIYGGLSKMFNSTVQEQLNLLQERFKSESANSTNQWQQRVAQQVPAFFKQMASKVGQSQEELNRVIRNVLQMNASALNRPAEGMLQPNSFFRSFDHFLADPSGAFFGPAPAIENQERTTSNGTQNQMRQLAGRVREMWHNQVEPELMMIRNHMSRVWRDLVGTGAMTRARQNGLTGSQEGNSSELVDSILKEVDMSASNEYTLIEPKSDGESDSSARPAEKQQQQQSAGIKLSPQMQNRVTEMQAELNRLWLGLGNSLEGALANVRRTLNPQPQFEFMGAASSSDGAKLAESTDPKQNEISERIKELNRLQRDADLVHQVVQQQQQEAQQRQSLGDRFRGLLNNVDMRQLNQLPDRLGEQFNRFGNAVGNFWNRLPEQWDNFVSNARPTQARGGGGTSNTTSAPLEK